MKPSIAGVLGLAMMAGCVDAPSAPAGTADPWTPAPGIPARAKLTCSPDGSVTLSTDLVQPQPDGVHLRVVNGSDEAVSVEGFDADPGTTNWVLSRGPGTMGLTCWPFSQHASGEAPTPSPLEIVDPRRLYVDGSVECEIRSHTSVDFAEPPIDDGPPPLEVARDLIIGLEPDDLLRLTGYPEGDRGGIAVIRDGQVVASYGIMRFEGEPWSIAAGSACSDTGLPFEGESVG